MSAIALVSSTIPSSGKLQNLIRGWQSMATQIINSERRFQIWTYWVSHQQLLLRSNKSDNVSTRIEVLFEGVLEFHLPTSFDGLSVQRASDDEIRNLGILKESTLQEFPQFKVYSVKGTDFIGYVAAANCACHEDEKEYNEPSFFGIGYPAGA